MRDRRERLEESNPQNLANTVRAFATLGVQQELFGANAGRALVRLEECNPQALEGEACNWRWEGLLCRPNPEEMHWDQMRCRRGIS